MKTVNGVCACGCGNPTTVHRGIIRKYIRGHNSRVERSYRNGGLCFNKNNGRWYIRCRDGKYQLYARAVMEAHTKRHLKHNEVVHHKNGVITDDGIENLVLMTRSQHIRFHCIKDSSVKYFKGYKTPIKYSEQDLIRSLKKCSGILNKIPTIKEYDKHNKAPSEKVIRKRFGGWPNALKKAGLI